MQQAQKSVEETVAAIQKLDLDPIKLKLMDPEEGQGWAREYVDQMELAYKRFLTLLVKYPNDTIAPTKDVDKFWHGHILDTMKYAEDCQNIFGYFLHHFPYFGMRGEEDAANLRAAGERMHAIYESEFGAEIPNRLADSKSATGDQSAASAWCYAAKPAVKSDAAWCYAAKPAVKSDAAWCYAAKPALKSDAAWCYAAKPAMKSDTAWCYAAKPAMKSDAAWCYAAKPAMKSDAAWCYAAKPAVNSDSAWCYAAKPAMKSDAAWCYAAKPALQSNAAWCYAAASTRIGPDVTVRPTLLPTGSN